MDCIKTFWNRLKQEALQGRVQEGATLFRELQVLGNVNNCVQEMMTTMVLVGATLCLAFSLVAAIILAEKATEGYQMAVALFVLFVVCMLFVIFVVYGGMSGVHEKCRDIIEQNVNLLHCDLVAKGISKATRSWQKRFFISCSLIQVRFGANNFVEKLTPLNATNAALGLTVQLLLLSG